MAKKLMFGGKESVKEELAEAKALKSGKMSKQDYIKGEKSEGESKGVAKKASAIKSGKLSPAAYAKGEKPFKCGGKVKKYAEGGEVEGDYEYSGSVEDAMATAKARIAEKDAEYAAANPQANPQAEVSKPRPKPVAKPKPKVTPRKVASDGSVDYGTFKASPIKTDKLGKDGSVDYGTFKASKLSKDEYDNAGKKPTSLSRKDVTGDISVPRSKRFAAGGMVRGTGAATKGKKFSGCF